MDVDPQTTEYGKDINTRQREEEKQERYHNIASKLRDKQGFLFAAREFIKDQPIYYDKNLIWWLWNTKETRWELTDETDILNIVTDALQAYSIGDTSVKNKTLMIEALRQEGRKNKPEDLPKEWIQFKDEFFDLKSKQSFPVTSKYFCVNPIPWSIAETQDTPIITKLFDEWVGPEHTQTLYEIIAYLCYTDYPIHLIFCLVGSGRNGKSKFQGLIRRFIGETNLCSTELETLIENRFETFKLYKKLGCLLGETNFNTLRNTSLLKRLVGQDLIGFEAKNKLGFDSINYAKIIISTNALPTSDDTSDGFYRRWLIINFPNEFPEGKDILDSIPEVEYRCLAKKITLLLPLLLERSMFSNQGSVEERKQRYVETSNPLQTFINYYCVVDTNTQVTYSLLYTKYVQWLTDSKRRVVSRKEFSDMLERAGHEIKKTNLRNIDTGQYEMGRFVFGLALKVVLTDYVPHVPIVPVVSTTPPAYEANSNMGHIGHNGHNAFPARLNAVQKEVEEGPSFPMELSKCDRFFVWLRSGTDGFRLENDALRTWPDINLADLQANGDIFFPKPGIIKARE